MGGVSGTCLLDRKSSMKKSEVDTKESSYRRVSFDDVVKVDKGNYVSLDDSWKADLGLLESFSEVKATETAETATVTTIATATATAILTATATAAAIVTATTTATETETADNTEIRSKKECPVELCARVNGEESKEGTTKINEKKHGGIRISTVRLNPFKRSPRKDTKTEVNVTTVTYKKVEQQMKNQNKTKAENNKSCDLASTSVVIVRKPTVTVGSNEVDKTVLKDATPYVSNTETKKKREYDNLEILKSKGHNRDNSPKRSPQRLSTQENYSSKVNKNRVASKSQQIQQKISAFETSNKHSPVDTVEISKLEEKKEFEPKKKLEQRKTFKLTKYFA